MHVAIAINAQLPVSLYGGTERIAVWLGQALAEMGHRVSFFCKPGSKLDFATCLPFPASSSEWNALAAKGQYDIVHFFSLPSPDDRFDFPYLVSVEGNGQAGERFLPNTVFVTRDHATRHHWTEFVYNGLPPEEFPLNPKPRHEKLLFLSKASWRPKNLPGALRIARQARMPIEVGGGKRPLNWTGLSSWHAHFNGEVGGEKKLGLLQKAKALLFPVIWREPFGIVMIEALSCGTPVLGTAHGSIPEIVDTSCGFLGKSEEDFVHFIRQGFSFDPEACRAQVLKKFTHLQMAANYLVAYQKILRDGKLREGAPYVGADEHPGAIAPLPLP